MEIAVVVGSRDWYVHYGRTVKVEASTPDEAEVIVEATLNDWEEVCAVIWPSEVDGGLNILDRNPKSG